MNAVYRIGPGDEHRGYPYQAWTQGYPWPTLPDTPALTSEYPIQYIKKWEQTTLHVSTGAFYTSGGYIYSSAQYKTYVLSAGVWVDLGFNPAGTQITQASGDMQLNNDIYTDITFTAAWREATTTGSGQSKIRVRTMVRI